MQVVVTKWFLLSVEESVWTRLLVICKFLCTLSIGV